MKDESRASFGAYRRIKHGIIDLTYQPGGKLSEMRLAEELGVGRSPIRTALARLEGEGWIEVSPQSGTFVRALSTREIDELSEMRGILEAHCIGITVERISDEALKKLGKAFRESSPKIRRGDAEAFIDLDSRLHSLSYQAAGNELIAQTLTGLRDKVQWIRRACSVSGERVLDGFKEIEGIYDALVRRDAETARQRMKSHIENAARFCQMCESQLRRSETRHA
jgi:DNA-binding GntR family transcriptional regulator